MVAQESKPVEPEIAPDARPWPWAGRQTATLRPYATGQQRLMTFFLIVTVVFLLAIAGVSIALLDDFRPPLMPVEQTQPVPAPSPAP